jgi:hypothetical protein
VSHCDERKAVAYQRKLRDIGGGEHNPQAVIEEAMGNPKFKAFFCALQTKIVRAFLVHEIVWSV